MTGVQRVLFRSGTYNRFLPLFVERSKRLPLPEGTEWSTVADYADRLAKAAQVARQVGRIGLDGPAVKLWKEQLYDEFTDSDDEDKAWTEFARRGAPYALRVAGMYAALDGRKAISEADLEAAGALVRYAVESARYVLDDTNRDPRVDRVTRAIDQAGTKGMSRSDVSSLFSRNLSAKVLDALLDEITRTGRYEQVNVSTGGRPAIQYRKVLSSYFVPGESTQEEEPCPGSP